MYVQKSEPGKYLLVHKPPDSLPWQRSILSPSEGLHQSSHKPFVWQLKSFSTTPPEQERVREWGKLKSFVIFSLPKRIVSRRVTFSWAGCHSTTLYLCKPLPCLWLVTSLSRCHLPRSFGRCNPYRTMTYLQRAKLRQSISTLVC